MYMYIYIVYVYVYTYTYIYIYIIQVYFYTMCSYRSIIHTLYMFAPCFDNYAQSAVNTDRFGLHGLVKVSPWGGAVGYGRFLNMLSCQLCKVCVVFVLGPFP